MVEISIIAEQIEKKRNEYIDISKQIWNFAETRFKEHHSAELLCSTLDKEGFQVERGVGGIETAFIGSFGQGHPIIAVLGEYDALSGMSQKPAFTEQSPYIPGANGHGCGHNLLGTASLAAAITVKHFLEEKHLSGTIRYYGCPAEEGGSGKTYMVREGLFQDVDLAFCWHPMDKNGVLRMNALANYQVYYKFKGKSSHAAAAPEMGRSALDAVELMNVGVNYLREHTIQEARVHYAVTNTGGISPNVVQAEAEVLYLIRAPEIAQVQEIYERVTQIAEGAALMTGTIVEKNFDKACSNIIPNELLNRIIFDKFSALGVPLYTPEEQQFARKISETLPDSAKKHSHKETSIATWIEPNDGSFGMTGSSDVGDVSWVVPTAQCQAACFTLGTSLHSWQWVSTGATSIAQKGMLQAAKVLAATMIEAFENPALIEEAKKEHQQRLNGRVYHSPIPASVKPKIPVTN